MSNEKKSIGKLLLGTWNTKTIVGVAIGAALFGVLMVYGGIRVFTNTSLTSAMIVVAVVAALFGPLPAALAAGIGNVLADLIGGWGFWFDWSIGNFVLGFFVGLIPLYGARIEDGIFNVKHAIFYVISVLVGNIVGFGLVTPVLTVLFYSSELTITWLQAFSAIVSNGIVLIVVGIPLLVILAKRNAKKTNLTTED
ncbi:MAG: ECF-type riboflavin transporter substrate-binding protein [Lachnospiraceae bacterium]|nr:ECF-type riboflavin transporter substrate-binding protein [Lachnospiraceae bacterium]